MTSNKDPIMCAWRDVWSLTAAVIDCWNLACNSLVTLQMVEFENEDCFNVIACLWGLGVSDEGWKGFSLAHNYKSPILVLRHYLFIVVISFTCVGTRSLRPTLPPCPSPR